MADRSYEVYVPRSSEKLVPDAPSVEARSGEASSDKSGEAAISDIDEISGLPSSS